MHNENDIHSAAPGPLRAPLRHQSRLALAIGALSLVGMVAATAVPQPEERPAVRETVIERLAPAATLIAPPADALFLREERVQRGDTLAALLNRLGIADRGAEEFLRTDRTAQTIARQLAPGKTVTARTTLAGELRALYFPLNGKDELLVVERGPAGTLTTQTRTLALETRTEMAAGEIQYSLFGATDAAGVPDAIATQLAEIFGGDIDFHRDLRRGDRFRIVYESLHHQGQAVRSGRILAAEFVNDRKVHTAFWHQPGGGAPGGYYSAEGRSLRKAFLRSPLEFSRVTSGFTGNRFHPVLREWRAHKGVDYGAPVGTRVRAVADGVVDFAGRQGGYGNLLVIRHNGAQSTAYGHLNGFAPGVRKGSRVNQGEVIGYVGQTGLASGPHLHYEFRVNGQQVNPLAVTLPPAQPLERHQIGIFLDRTRDLRAQLDLVSPPAELAQAPGG